MAEVQAVLRDFGYEARVDGGGENSFFIPRLFWGRTTTDLYRGVHGSDASARGVGER